MASSARNRLTKISAIAAGAIALAACSDPETAKRAAEDMGLTDVQTTGYDFFACGKDDLYSTGFTAKRGDRVVHGVVCSGILKGATVRLF